MEVDQPEETPEQIIEKQASQSPLPRKSPLPVDMNVDDIICMSETFTSESGGSDESFSSPKEGEGPTPSFSSPSPGGETDTTTTTVNSTADEQNHNKCNGITTMASNAPRGKRKLTEESGTATQYEELVDVIEKGKERLMEALARDTVILNDLEEGGKIVDEMMEKKSPVAVDCEGVNLGDRRSGKVTLIQVGDMFGNVYIFDVQEEPKLAEELKRLLECEDVIKVMHDCRSDSEGLNHQFKINIKNVFDTQVAHIVIRKGTKEFQRSDKNVGLDVVCKTYGGYPNPFKENIKGVYRHDQAYWTNRPLNDVMISYAASDVLCLVPTVYKELNSLIVSDEDKKLFAESCDAHINQLQDKHDKKSGHSSRNRNHRGSGGGGGHYHRNRGTGGGYNNVRSHQHHGEVDSGLPSQNHRDRGYNNRGGEDRHGGERDGGGRSRGYHGSNEYSHHRSPYGGGGGGRGRRTDY